MENISVLSLLSWFQDVDEFFESEKTFLIAYHTKIKDATHKSDKMTKAHKSKLPEHFVNSK